LVRMHQIRQLHIFFTYDIHYVFVILNVNAGVACEVQAAGTVVQSDCSTMCVLAGVCAVQATSAVRFVAGAIAPVYHTLIVQS